MGWRLAYSLEQLRSEVNALYPNRSKASDGTIGDAAHAASASDHNPNAAGVVCAFDITHDPVHGPDIGALFELFRTNPHPDAKYLIANRRVASRKYGWVSRPYTGIDPHTNHIHVSVGVGPDGKSQPPYDDRFPWFTVAPPQEDDLTDEEHVQLWNTRADVDSLHIKVDQANQAIAALTQKVGGISTGAVDVNALAAKVADLLAQRLAS